MPNTSLLPITIPPDVRDYCRAHGLEADLELAIRVAEEAYEPVKAWGICLEPDPEVEDEEYVVIDVTTAGTDEELSGKHEGFLTRWAQSASPEATWRIRVLFNLGR